MATDNLTEKAYFFPACRGGTCDRGMVCVEGAGCLYRSSAEEAQEVISARRAASLEAGVLDYESSPLRTVTYGAKPVADYKGVVDGGGYKASMDDPKKLPLALIDPGFILGTGRVLAHGAKKYAPGNWMRGMKYSEVLSAMQRHYTAILGGQDRDEETGELHVYHIACCAMFLAHFQESTEKYATFDDRLFK